MNLNAEISKDSFYNFYEDNKDYIVPLVAILISILLFIFIIIPQILSLPQKKGAFDQEAQKVANLKDYQQRVVSTDATQLDSDIETVSQVLPSAKDFNAILNAILAAANNSASPVDSYTFQTDVQPGKEDSRSIPELRFSINILGGPDQAVSFINELYNTAPISEVSQITTKDDITQLIIVFYYKPFPPVGFEERTAAAPLSAEEREVLERVTGWSRPINAELFTDEISSPSAQESSF